jgi:hypothetical protein
VHVPVAREQPVEEVEVLAYPAEHVHGEEEQTVLDEL